MKNARRRRIARFNPVFAVLIAALLMLLIGCDYEKRKAEKYRASVNPENGKIVEVDGEKFRIVYIGGVRFRFPDTRQFGGGGIYVDKSNEHLPPDPLINTLYMDLYWPDIPPGKAPGTTYKALDKLGGRTNSVDVLVKGTDKPIIIDHTKTVEQRHRLDPAIYDVHDDLNLGLRIYNPKTHPDLAEYAVALTEDATEPWGGQPIVIQTGYIFFSYAPQVRVRIVMTGWLGRINPDWKGIYLGVVETLNKYREDKTS